jgi:hypothetical protein
MTPALKRVILFYALILPGFSLMMFAFSRYPSNGVPVWVPIGWGFYMLATITFMTLFGQRIFKSPSAPTKPPAAQASATARAVWLIAVWSVLFLYGAFEFAKGDFPAERAIPSGALLLAFILLFAWLMRRDMKAQRAASDAPSSNGDDSLGPLH